MRYRDVCKMTLRPRRWTTNPAIMTERCLVGECATCDRKYVGKGHTDGLVQGRDLWENQYCLCNTTKEEDLTLYGESLYVLLANVPLLRIQRIYGRDVSETVREYWKERLGN